MSRQSKSAKNKIKAQMFSEARKSGSAGPSKTEPKHGKSKSNRWFMEGITSAGERAFGKGKK